MKFIKKPEPVTAVKYDGTNEEEMTYFTGHRAPIGLALKQEALGGYIRIAGIVLAPGDWLIKDSKGIYSSCDSVTFEDTYKPDWPVILKD